MTSKTKMARGILTALAMLLLTFAIPRGGAVLDAGCGTGENALHVASLGLSVLGVDVPQTALAIAREKADNRGIEVEFAAADDR